SKDRVAGSTCLWLLIPVGKSLPSNGAGTSLSIKRPPRPKVRSWSAWSGTAVVFPGVWEPGKHRHSVHPVRIQSCRSSRITCPLPPPLGKTTESLTLKRLSPRSFLDRWELMEGTSKRPLPSWSRLRRETCLQRDAPPTFGLVLILRKS